MCRNIFTIQHTLTSNITGSRESSLDGAKTFYELLTLRQQVLSWTNIYCDKGTFNVSFYLSGHSKRDSGEGTRLHQGGLHSRPGAVAQERSQLELDHPEQARWETTLNSRSSRSHRLGKLLIVRLTLLCCIYVRFFIIRLLNRDDRYPRCCAQSFKYFPNIRAAGVPGQPGRHRAGLFPSNVSPNDVCSKSPWPKDLWPNPKNLMFKSA